MEKRKSIIKEIFCVVKKIFKSSLVKPTKRLEGEKGDKRGAKKEMWETG